MGRERIPAVPPNLPFRAGSAANSWRFCHSEHREESHQRLAPRVTPGLRPKLLGGMNAVPLGSSGANFFQLHSGGDLNPAPASLSGCTGVLFSIKAFGGSVVLVIIRERQGMSRLSNPLPASPIRSTRMVKVGFCLRFIYRICISK